MKIKNIILATLLTVIIMPASAKTVDKILLLSAKS